MPDAVNGNGSGEVRFSVKELLLNIRSDIAAISAKIDLKADQSTVAALDMRVRQVEDPNRMTLYGRQLLDQFQAVVRDVESLKINAVSEKTLTDYQASQRTQRNWLVGLVFSNAIAIIAIAVRFYSEHQ